MSFEAVAAEGGNCKGEMRPFRLEDVQFTEDCETTHNFHDHVLFARPPAKRWLNLLPIPSKPGRGARGFEGIKPLQVPRKWFIEEKD